MRQKHKRRNCERSNSKENKKGKAGYKKIYSAITYNIKNKKKSKKQRR